MVLVASCSGHKDRPEGSGSGHGQGDIGRDELPVSLPHRVDGFHMLACVDSRDANDRAENSQNSQT